MALIKCPECSNEISDQAIACPKCGYPLEADSKSPDLDAQIKQSLQNEGPIAAIKLYREKNPGAGLLEAKQYVEKIQATLPAGTKPQPRSRGCLLMLAIMITAALALSIFAAISQ